MSLTRIRRSSRIIAALLLLAAVRLPHAAVDDAACVPAEMGTFAGHDESQHGFRAGSPNEREHCAVCHWTRSLRAPRTPSAVAAAEFAPPAVLHLAEPAEVLSAVLEHLPARAPPSAIL